MGTTPSSSPLVHIESAEGIPVVVVAGRLDTSNTGVFDSQVAPLLSAPCPRILLDMKAVTFVSSLGLRSILKVIKHAAVSGGRAAAFSVPQMVLEVLEMSGFTALLDIYPDRESALSGRR